jgi:hypothetical protein
MGFKSRFAIGATALLYVQGASAFELTLFAGAELEWTDNVFLSDQNKRNDLLEVINVGARAEEAEAWYTVNINYDISYEQYERESYDAETYFNGAASINLIPLPDRFEWLFSVESETTLSQSVLPDTPDNRDQRNTYTTAPRLTLLSLPRDDVYLTAEASKVTFRNATDSESDRLGGSLSWLHALSSLTGLNVSAGYEKVNFEVSEDYEREYYNIGFDRELKSGAFSISAGQTRLTPEFTEELDGLNFLASLEWGLDAHTLRIEAAHDLTDTSVAFEEGVRTEFEQFSVDDVNTAEVDIITRTRLTLSDTYSPNRTSSIYGEIYTDQEKSETDDSETDRAGGVLTFRREMRPGLNAELMLAYEKSRELPTEIEDDTANIRLSLAKQFGEPLTVASWIEREDSDSDIDLLDYEAHRVGISLTAEF